MPEIEPTPPTDAIGATLYRVGVNFGDHGETIVTQHEVAHGETVRNLLERLIPAGKPYRPRDYDHYVTLRFVEPAPAEVNTDG